MELGKTIRDNGNFFLFRGKKCSLKVKKKNIKNLTSISHDLINGRNAAIFRI